MSFRVIFFSLLLSVSVTVSSHVVFSGWSTWRKANTYRSSWTSWRRRSSPWSWRSKRLIWTSSITRTPREARASRATSKRCDFHGIIHASLLTRPDSAIQNSTIPNFPHVILTFLVVLLFAPVRSACTYDLEMMRQQFGLKSDQKFHELKTEAKCNSVFEEKSEQMGIYVP